MHEHYEDCPWREQGLYTFDSRNEMLCSYFSLEGFAYQRANLLLIAKGVREDGFLELTFPARNTPAIPMFSLIYVIELYEYVLYSKDESILPEVRDVVKRIMDNFRKTKRNGLLPEFPYPFWNFYEWGNESDNATDLGRKKDDAYVERYSLILNCVYLLAEEKFGKLYPQFSEKTEETEKSVYTAFYDEKRGLFRAYKDKNIYTQFGNSLAVLVGLGGEDTVEKMIRGETLPVSLSASVFYYDALLKYKEKYKDVIIKDIDDKYGFMLKAGATSFWETIDGPFDKSGSCSLCHGWSALPIYYYRILGLVK